MRHSPRANRIRSRSPLLTLSLLLLSPISPFSPLAAGPAAAQVTPWITAHPLGPNEVVYTIDITCTAAGLVCELLDSYSDTQVASLGGFGEMNIDVVAGTFSFLQQGTQDLDDGMGPRPAYAVVAASDLLFEEIPFVGAPITEDGVVFALTNPVFDAGGPLTPGDYPFSTVVSYSALADIVGPVDAYMPILALTPSDVTLSGVLRVDASGHRFELRDVTGTLLVENPTTLLGEDVTVSVTADMTLNLVASTTPPFSVPALGPTAAAALIMVLSCAGGLAARRTAPRTTRTERRHR